MVRAFVYLAAVVDWFSRRGVRAWWLLITMDTLFHIKAQQEVPVSARQPD